MHPAAVGLLKTKGLLGLENQSVESPSVKQTGEIPVIRRSLKALGWFVAESRTAQSRKALGNGNLGCMHAVRAGAQTTLILTPMRGRGRPPHF